MMAGNDGSTTDDDDDYHDDGDDDDDDDDDYPPHDCQLHDCPPPPLYVLQVRSVPMI